MNVLDKKNWNPNAETAVSDNLDRSQVDPAKTWNLSPLFTDDEAWEKTFAQAQTTLPELEAFAGDLTTSADRLLAFYLLAEEQSRVLAKLYCYASLKHDEDTAVSKYAGMDSRIEQFAARFSAATAFAEPAIAALSDETMEEFYRSEPKLEHYRRRFSRIRAAKPHMLSPETEQVLAAAGPVFDSGSTIYGVLDNADQVFPKIKNAEGQEVELTHANFIPLLQSQDRRVRKDAFEGYYSTYQQYRNTYATTLASQVKYHNFAAKVRKFPQARTAALFYNEIPEAVYDRLLAGVHDHFDLFHRYIGLRKELLRLDELHSYDLYVPVVPKLDLKYTFDEAKTMVLEAMAPLGREYGKILEKAFDERWIDYAVNKGKRSGAYSDGCHDSYPYILTSYQGTLSDVYTLAHELGHSCHSYLSREHQSSVYSGYPIFLAEIASTTNENLLTHYLLQTIQDETVRQYIIMNYLDGFKGTVFRQTQFADFELKVHRADQEGVALTADWLCDVYGQMNAEYYGPDLAADPEIRLEWARIPHFYYNFYVYQYATGFSAANAFARRILQGGENELQGYLGFLSSGCSEKPLDTLKKAGVDMTSSRPLEDAMASFRSHLELLEK